MAIWLCYQEIVEFLAAVLSGAQKYDQAIDKQVAENFLVPAERLLADKETFPIDVEMLENDVAIWLKPPAPPASAKAEEVVKEVNPEETTKESAPEETAVPDPLVEAEAVTDHTPGRSEEFPLLFLSRCQQDMLDRLQQDDWDKAFMQACTSASD